MSEYICVNLITILSINVNYIAKFGLGFFVHYNGYLSKNVNNLYTNTAGPGDEYTDYVATRWYRAPELLG